ncbi:MAG: hypothetical protein HYX63_01510 [Gammaproteobacteria bacterium]|nr:hypothetical protein [Gammaproteobacteria bacterium]
MNAVRDPQTIQAEKQRLWAAMKRSPSLEALAKNDPLFQRLLDELVTHFGVETVTDTGWRKVMGDD